MILVVFSYPLQAHPCRASLDKILAWTSPETRNRKVPPPPSAFKYFVVTTCILVASYLIAITVTELDVVSVHQEEKRKDGMLTACLGSCICWIDWIDHDFFYPTWYLLLQTSSRGSLGTRQDYSSVFGHLWHHGHVCLLDI